MSGWASLEELERHIEKLKVAKNKAPARLCVPGCSRATGLLATKRHRINKRDKRIDHRHLRNSTSQQQTTYGTRRLNFATITPPCWAVEFGRNGFRSRRTAAPRWMRTTTRRPVSRNVVRAGQTGLRSDCHFVAVQVPSSENGAQADFLCGTGRHGQTTEAVRVISHPPEFLANGRLLGADTFRIDLGQEFSGCISIDDFADC